jgi:hypothetical protein
LQDNLVAATTIVQISQEEEEPHWGGLLPSRQIVPRDRFSGHHRLEAEYFCENAVFGDDLFRRLFVLVHHLCCNTNIDDNHCTDFCFKFAGSEC